MARSTTEEFIEKAKLVHGDKYDYSKVDYKHSKEKVIVTCSVHGDFFQRASHHLEGHGCYKCYLIEKTSNTEEFIKKAKLMHGEIFDYSKVKYIGIIKKIIIVCKEHGVFLQQPDNHLQGQGCPKCAGKNITTEEWIKRAKEIHGEKYDYSKVDYINNTTKLIITCPVHGDFLQVPRDHIDKKCGCPHCCESKGERATAKILTEMGITFERQKRYEDCKSINTLPFDFFLPEFNTVIEFQGIQHRKPVARFGGMKEFIELQKRDKIKFNYCNIENRPKLLIIEEIKDIKKALENM